MGGRAHDDLLPQRIWTLRKSGHEAAIDLRAVLGVGAEIVLSIAGELRRSRLYRARAGGIVRRDFRHAAGIRSEGMGMSVRPTGQLFMGLTLGQRVERAAQSCLSEGRTMRGFPSMVIA